MRCNRGVVPLLINLRLVSYLKNIMKNYKNYIESAFEEWQKNGFCSSALKLNTAIGSDYFDTCNPHFYTGDINSKLVMVQLNPKRELKDFNQKSTSTQAQYFDFYSNYGKVHYGIESKKNWKSKFDQKLIRFLRPLNLLELNSTDIFKNLENVVDQKLQVELIPFGSPSFDYTKFPQHLFSEYIELILGLITATERDCVIFGGRVFSQILSSYITSKEVFRFKLQKVNGNLTKNEYEIEKLTLCYEGIFFNAFITPQFAQQGLPVEAYGKKLAEIIKNLNK